MKPSLTDTLCTKCGLCCDGSLFADVELASRAEATKVELLGLEIEDSDAGQLLVQPCAALKGRRCTVYAHRPECCRTFECKLLQDVRRGAVSEQRAALHVEDALGRIGRVEQLLSKLGPSDARLPLKERCAEALGREGSTTSRASRTRAEIETEMRGLESLLRSVFLGRLEIG